jgi:prepilin-type N-terminal cleavage/methylation domain-containing protein
MEHNAECGANYSSVPLNPSDWELRSRGRQRSGRIEPCDEIGFTLMELLIVISIILILMLMAMPTIGSIKKRANETSAVNSLRTIVTA